MHCKYCNKPVEKGGYPDTIFCYSCQRILTIHDVIMDSADPPPKRDFDEMDSISLEKNQPQAPQPQAGQEVYHKVCRVCRCRVDYADDGSYYCPQCGMFKDENGVEVGSERIIPQPKGFSQSNAASNSTPFGSPGVTQSSIADKAQLVPFVALAFVSIISSIITAATGTFTIIPVVISISMWKRYASLTPPRHVVALICSLISVAVLLLCALSVFVIPFTPGQWYY